MKTQPSATLSLVCLGLTTLLSSLHCNGFLLERTMPSSPSYDRGTSTIPFSSVSASARTTLLAAHSRRQDNSAATDNYFLKDFVFYNGEILDPYQTLKVSRQADARAIKQAYRRQSRLYHPDAARHRDILPGACNDEAEVREQWERINWSYDLLSNTAQRRKYDRHEALADPARALRRAAAQAAWAGVTSVGQGLWSVGSAAVANIMTTAKETATVGVNVSGMRNGTSTVVEFKSYHAGFRSGLQEDAHDMEGYSGDDNKEPIVDPVKGS